MNIGLHILNLIILFLLISCSPNKSKKDSDNLNLTSKTNISTAEFSPKSKVASTYDTFLNELNISILIVDESLKTFVTDSFSIEGVKHIHNYRDFRKRLLIKNNRQTLIDTTLHKEDFKKWSNSEFIQGAIFKNYWFEEVKNNKLKFFGTITKPETDWTFAFYHMYNLSTKKIDLEVYKEEEI